MEPNGKQTNHRQKHQQYDETKPNKAVLDLNPDIL